LGKNFIKIVSKVIGIPSSKINSMTSPANTSSWNSIVTLLLISELEKQFKVELDIKDYSVIESLGDIVSLMRQKGLKIDFE
jgi:acyl carrier protein